MTRPINEDEKQTANRLLENARAAMRAIEHYDQPAVDRLCRAIAYVGEISFMQSLGLVIRQKGVLARLAFAPPIETAGRGRREIAAAAQDAISTLLGFSAPAPGTAPTSPRDLRAVPQ